MARIKVYVLVAANHAQAQANPLWQQWLENNASPSVLLTCSESLIKLANVPAWHYTREISLNEYVCFCCKAQGPVLALLRNLFLQALHRKMAPFEAVVVHTTEPLDAISLGRALQLDPFLKDRFEYVQAQALPVSCLGVIGAAVVQAKTLDDC